VEQLENQLRAEGGVAAKPSGGKGGKIRKIGLMYSGMMVSIG